LYQPASISSPNQEIKKSQSTPPHPISFCTTITLTIIINTTTITKTKNKTKTAATEIYAKRYNKHETQNVLL